MLASILNEGCHFLPSFCNTFVRVSHRTSPSPGSVSHWWAAQAEQPDQTFVSTGSMPSSACKLKGLSFFADIPRPVSPSAPKSISRQVQGASHAAEQAILVPDQAAWACNQQVFHSLHAAWAMLCDATVTARCSWQLPPDSGWPGVLAGYGRCWWARSGAAELPDQAAHAYRQQAFHSLQGRWLLPPALLDLTSLEACEPQHAAKEPTDTAELQANGRRQDHSAGKRLC